MPLFQLFGERVNLDIPKDVFITEQELEEMENTLPGCEHGWFTSIYEDAKLHYRKWLPQPTITTTPDSTTTTTTATKPKGIVIYMHGIQSHCGDGLIVKDRKLGASLLIDTLVTNNGYALYAFDQYGHGFSEGVRFYIPETWENNLQDYIHFCNLVAKQHEKDIPLFLIGESYGGNLTIHLAKKFQTDPLCGPPNFDSIILLAPAIEGDVPASPIYQLLKYILGPMCPLWTPCCMPNPISPDRLWRDEEILKLRSNPRYLETMIDGAGRPFQLGTALNLVLALESVKRNAIPGFRVPYCIMHGSSDFGVPISGSVYMFDETDTPESLKEIHCLEGAYHELLADEVAEKCMTITLRWLEKRLADRRKWGYIHSAHTRLLSHMKSRGLVPPYLGCMRLTQCDAGSNERTNERMVGSVS